MVIQDGSSSALIDRTSPVPLYSQLKTVLLASIQAGQFRAGDLFPTEREICEKFQISRITVRRAVDELAREGYLVTRQGKGTFVAQAKIQRPMTQMEGFSAATTAQGHRPGSRLHSLRHDQATEPAASLLQVSNDTWLWVVERLRLADEIPIGISTVYLNLPPGISLSPAELEQEVSLWSILRKKGVELSSSDETVQAVSASPEQAELLQVDTGFPLLLVEGIVFASSGTPLEYHQILNRGDRYKYSFKIVYIFYRIF